MNEAFTIFYFITRSYSMSRSGSSLAFIFYYSYFLNNIGQAFFSFYGNTAPTSFAQLSNEKNGVSFIWNSSSFFIRSALSDFRETILPLSPLLATDITSFIISFLKGDYFGF